MNMHSKYDKMHKNGMIYALKYTYNHVISSISCMLSLLPIVSYPRNENNSHEIEIFGNLLT